jgi:polyphosphate kinase
MKLPIAGSKNKLIVRGVCCLVPGVKGLSENISIKRIIDRYLEHGRIFIFHNDGNKEIFLGSADWMSRNIYRRIEVCFPIYDERIKKELIELVNIQLQDNIQAVMIDSNLQNVPIDSQINPIQSQYSIYQLLSSHAK